MGLLDKKIPLQKIAARLRSRRLKLGLSQGIIAHRAGIPAPYVSNVELGKTSLKIDAVRRVLLDAELSNRRWRKVERQIARRRAFLAAVPASPDKDALEGAMFARAEDLLLEGRAEEADVLLEFLPAAQADALLNRIFGEP